MGSPRHVQSVVEKIGESNQKVRKIGQIINQILALRPKHDKFKHDAFRYFVRNHVGKGMMV
jgi:hypothetical protein